MKKIIIVLGIILICVNSAFAIVTDITFHSKFEKPENITTNLNFNGFPVHSFKQHEIKYDFVKDERNDEYTYRDAKEKYNKERKGKFSSSYEFSKYSDKFEKKYRDNQYKEYKRDYYRSNKHKINYFKQEGLRFKSSENYALNNY